ncbi:MAG: peptidylprolyl isomerase, partial [Armatimonadetes bacterium]|nr:peptidylprolyl isomerase [Armatimonadota bacterium]
IAVGAVGAGAWMLTAGTRRASAVAARVNGEAIYWSEVDVEILRAARQFGIDPAGEEFKKQRAEITKAVLDQIIALRLIRQEARKRGLVASDKDVDEQLAAIRKQFPNEEAFNSALARSGLTLPQVRELIRDQLTQRRVADAVAQGTVTDEEVRKQFDGNRKQYDRPAQIKVSHILFRIGGKADEPVAAAKARIVQAKLADGAKFEDLAREYSDDKASAEQGGDLGLVPKGKLVKEFEDAAWALKPGQTSGPVRTEYGLHIIRVTAMQPAEQAEFDKVKDEIRAQMLGSKRQQAFEAWLDQQRKAAKVERFERI